MMLFVIRKSKNGVLNKLIYPIRAQEKIKDLSATIDEFRSIKAPICLATNYADSVQKSLVLYDL